MAARKSQWSGRMDDQIHSFKMSKHGKWSHFYDAFEATNVKVRTFTMKTCQGQEVTYIFKCMGLLPSIIFKWLSKTNIPVLNNQNLPKRYHVVMSFTMYHNKSFV